MVGRRSNLQGEARRSGATARGLAILLCREQFLLCRTDCRVRLERLRKRCLEGGRKHSRKAAGCGERPGELPGEMQIRGLCLRKLAAQLRERGLCQSQACIGLLRIGAAPLADIGKPRHLREGLLMAFLVVGGEVDQFAQPHDIQVGLCHPGTCALRGVRHLISGALGARLEAARLA